MKAQRRMKFMSLQFSIQDGRVFSLLNTKVRPFYIAHCTLTNIQLSKLYTIFRQLALAPLTPHFTITSFLPDSSIAPLIIVLENR